MIRIPDPADEDARHLNREMRTIKTEKTAHTNRIRSLLAAQGIAEVRITHSFASDLDKMVTGDGRHLGQMLKERLQREFKRLQLAVEQIRTLQMQTAALFRRAAKEVATNERQAFLASRQAQIAQHLNQLVGIGPVTSWTMATEVFAWRDIQNRRQLGALAGLTPTPHASGNEEREQGISKSGRGELRVLMIEIAWGWLRFQPQSKLARWYQDKFGEGTKRSRKIGIVALARKLLVALGKYVRSGEIPDGAKLAEELKFNYLVSLQPRTRQKETATTA
jgi:transposase